MAITTAEIEEAEAALQVLEQHAAEVPVFLNAGAGLDDAIEDVRPAFFVAVRPMDTPHRLSAQWAASGSVEGHARSAEARSRIRAAWEGRRTEWSSPLT